MSRTKWLSLGFMGCVVVACGGNVTLGQIGQSDGGSDSGTTSSSSSSSSSGSSGQPGACTDPAGCGPQPGEPSKKCDDGSFGGFTGRCVANEGGGCGWEYRECPPGPACFGKDGALDPSYKKCTTTADCTSVDWQTDCCGTLHSGGVSKAREAEVQACAKIKNAGYPLCGCAQQQTSADDKSSDAPGALKAVFCNAQNECETSFKGKDCGKKVCGPSQTCCEGLPLPEPTCMNGGACPISRAKYKKDIAYLSEAEKRQLSDDLMHIPLATYRYKSEGDADRAHLGFIIDDIAPSPAVSASGERVDLYGYTTMSVAAVQLQAKEIAELRKELDALRAELARSRDAKQR